MNNGLKIILARMDTNPEEFEMMYPLNKWSDLVDRHWDIFTEEERDEYQAKLRVILGDKFSELVLKELMENDEDEDKLTTTMKYKASNRYAIGGWTDARSLVSLSQTQVAMAQKMGIPLEDYAKALAKQGL